MDSLDNKRLLWDTLIEQDLFKKDVSVEKTQAIFETLLNEINQLEVTMDEKNKSFLTEWIKQIDTASMIARSEQLEERMKQRQYKQPPTVSELAEIKQLLYRILEILE
jgi:predicted component of type VI protein secretion system